MLVLATGCNDGDIPAGGGSGSDSGTPTDTDAADETTSDDNGVTPTPTCELDDSWLALPPMSVPRSTRQAVRLSDGSVLVPGGVTFVGTESFETMPMAAADRFDPTTNTWATLPDMLMPRSGHGLLPLSDGDVLVVGGWSEDPDVSVSDVERFDLETSTWQPVAPLPEAMDHVLAATNGDRRVVLGQVGHEPRALAWVDEGWQPIAAPRAVFSSMDLLPFGSGFVLAGTGADRATVYDPTSDQWVPTPDEVDWHPEWLTGMSDYVQGAALLGPDELFVLATTGGLHPDIEQQGVAARFSTASTSWQGGAPGPLRGDVGVADARGFAPGWVLVANVTRGNVYDGTADTWCTTAESPSPAIGATVVLGDGSVLFAGSPVEGEVPLRWTPW